MSNALAIAGVTAFLRNLLDDGLIDQVTDALGTGFTVSASAPDLIKLDDANAPPRLNLFLHQVTPNISYRNFGLPSHAADGTRIANPPLALDLHYLLTAYGTADMHAEILLGYAMQLLHETPTLVRDAVRLALNPSNFPLSPPNLLPKLYETLRATDLAEQVEQIKIVPSHLNSEEMSKLWTAIQTHYRPSTAYQVSVILIDSRRPARAALPVLKRGPIDPVSGRERGPVVQADLVSPFPEITDLTLPSSRIVAQLGDSITVNGSNLDGSAQTLVLQNRRLDVVQRIAAAAGATAGAVTFPLPPAAPLGSTAPPALPAGTYDLSVEVVRPGESAPRTTNTLALSIAPVIVDVPTSPVLPDNAGTAFISIDCTPALLPNQRVSLIVGSDEILADPFAGPTTAPTFTWPAARLGSSFWVRLRVDGVDSVLIDRTQTPLQFVGPKLRIGP
jgi:hypothetical protein